MIRPPWASLYRLPLVWKLISVGMSATLAALGITTAVLIAFDTADSRDRLIREAETLARVIGENSTAVLTFGDAGAAAQTLAAAGTTDRVLAAELLYADGSVAAQHRRARPPAPPIPDYARADVARGGAWTRFSAATGLTVVQPVLLDRARIGTVVVWYDLAEFRARGVRVAVVTGLALLVAVLIAFAVSSWMQRVISVPLLQLTRVSRSITRDRRYDVRAGRAGDDEIGELIDAFNEMLGEIQRRDADLLRHQDALERTVEARTAELRAVNEKLVAARDRAMDASRAKSEFLANMSHEIRTPMNGIIGMTDLALDEEPSEPQRERLRMVKTSAESLLAIVNDILDFSKIESRKLELEAVPFSVREAVSDTVNSLAVRAAEKGLEVIVDVAPGLPTSVIGDPVRLRQILWNLVGNAIKFTEQGHVLVRVTEDARVEGHTRLRFDVSDTGIGIAAAKHETIFEAFSQADGSTTRRYGGTGLGLTISATLVRMMGGTIWVESEEGAGSTFHFTAAFDLDPSVPDPAPSATPALAGPVVRALRPGAAPVPVHARKRVLLAEDNLVNQQVALGMLSRRGHVVTVVGNGQEALDACAREVFDIVLMDIQMPVLGGLDATAAIRRREEGTGRHMRIVAMTAHALAGDRERCLAAGMDGYLAKPIDRRVLLAAVEEADAAAVPVPALDTTDALARLGGDAELLAEMVRLFLDDCPARLTAIKTAVDAGDPEAVRVAAHALKGAAATLSVRRVAEAARVLERLGAEHRMDAIDAAWRQLSAEACAALDELRTGPLARHPHTAQVFPDAVSEHS